MERQEMEGKQRRKALLVTHVSGFVPQFEMNNVIFYRKWDTRFIMPQIFIRRPMERIITVWMEPGLSVTRLILYGVRLISGIFRCTVRWLS